MKFFLPLLLFAPSILFSQPVVESMSKYFVEVQSGKHPAIPQEIYKTDNTIAVSNSLTQYYNDSVSTVRAKAYAITKTIGLKSTQVTVRQDCVQQLVQACKDSDSGNVGLVLDYLKLFTKGDFSPTTKDSLRSLFNRKPPHFDELLKLIGFVNLPDFKNKIIPYSQAGNSKEVRLAALLCLARMGDQHALDDLMARVEKLPINDQVIENLFPDLVYTRQKPAFDYMITVLQSENKNCSSYDETTKIFCGYRVMEQLAPAIEGYPLKLDVSGDVQVEDYSKALQSVKDWFNKKNKDYIILTDKY